jgi:hypothetical protein
MTTATEADLVERIRAAVRRDVDMIKDGLHQIEMGVAMIDIGLHGAEKFIGSTPEQ